MTTLTINLAHSTSDLTSDRGHCRGGKEKRKTKHHNTNCSKLDASLTRVFKKLQKPYFLGTLNSLLTEESACSSSTSVMKTAGIKEAHC